MKGVLCLLVCLVLLFDMAGVLAEAWSCPKCGKESEGNFCPWCGSKKPETPEKVICPSCGAAWDATQGYAFCPSCGSALVDGSVSERAAEENANVIIIITPEPVATPESTPTPTPIVPNIKASYEGGNGSEKYDENLPIVVSMGDSYAAGEGVPPFYGFSDGLSPQELINNADWLAHRSKNAWSGQLMFTNRETGEKVRIGEYKDANWFFTAVSGAVTGNIGATEAQTEDKVEINGQERPRLQLTSVNDKGEIDGIEKGQFTGTPQKKDYSITDENGNVYEDKVYLPNQIDVFDELRSRGQDGLKADYVTLSLGGNDVDFAGILKTAIMENQYFLGTDLHYLKNLVSKICVENQGPFAGIFDLIYNIILSSSDKLEPALFLQKAIGEIINNFDSYDNDGGSTHDKLKQAYINIADAAGPQAKILVTGYPKLLDDKIEKKTYPDLSKVVNNPGASLEDQALILLWNTQGKILFADKDAEIINKASIYLNNKIIEVISELQLEGMNIYFVPIEFGNHAAYSDEPWINPVIVPALSDDIDWFLPLSSYSIHPNYEGVSEYTKAVQAMVDVLEVDPVVSGKVSFTDADGSEGQPEKAQIIFTTNDGDNTQYMADIDGKGYYSIQLPRNEYTVKIVRPNDGKEYTIDLDKAFIEFGEVSTPKGARPAYELLESESGNLPVNGWLASGNGAFTRYNENIGLRLRINCLVSCSQDYTVKTMPSENDTSPDASTDPINGNELGNRVCLWDMECTDEGHYTGNMGDSRVFRLDAAEFIGYEPRGYSEGSTKVTKRNGNIGIDDSVYDYGFEVWIARWNGGDNISWAYRTFKLNRQYQILTGKSGLINSYNTMNFDDTVYFYNGDEIIYSFRLTPDDYSHEFTINVEGVDEITIEIKDNKKLAGGTSFALYDLFLMEVPSLDDK